MKLNLTKNELQILYTLLNDHLNTIGDIGAHFLSTSPVDGKKGDYVWEMEKLEQKLLAAFGLKPM